jgi:hypothetical protein
MACATHTPATCSRWESVDQHSNARRTVRPSRRTPTTPSVTRFSTGTPAPCHRHRPVRECGSGREPGRQVGRERPLAGILGPQRTLGQMYYGTPICSLQLRVLRLGLLQDGNVGVGVFPEGEEDFRAPPSRARRFPGYSYHAAGEGNHPGRVPPNIQAAGMRPGGHL